MRLAALLLQGESEFVGLLAERGAIKIVAALDVADDLVPVFLRQRVNAPDDLLVLLLRRVVELRG
jgi:hypothetical protein